MGRLAPPPRSPTSDSSPASRAPIGDRPHHGASLRGVSPASATAWLRAQPRTVRAEAAAGDLRVEGTFALRRPTDDLEVDEENDVLHARSASRPGHPDPGADRRRVEGAATGVRTPAGRDLRAPAASVPTTLLDCLRPHPTIAPSSATDSARDPAAAQRTSQHGLLARLHQPPAE